MTRSGWLISLACGEGRAVCQCTPRPDACTQQYDPVCGCDDQTYGDACAAHTAGVSVQYQGECDGVACTDDAMECPDGSYVGRVPPTCEFAPCPSARR